MKRALDFVWYCFCFLATSPYMHRLMFLLGSFILLELLLPIHNEGWWHWLRNPVIAISALALSHLGTILIHGYTVHGDD